MHAFERYAFPVLTVIFVVVSIWVLTKAHPGTAHHTIPGGFLVMLGATFGYAAGWNPYAADYTRYLEPRRPRRAWSACSPGSASSRRAFCWRRRARLQ